MYKKRPIIKFYFGRFVELISVLKLCKKKYQFFFYLLYKRFFLHLKQNYIHNNYKQLWFLNIFR